MFTNDFKIKVLNLQYLNRRHATDVLAFDLTNPLLKQKKLEGEIVISTDTVKRNARTYGTAAKDELILCVAHGILHLLGCDDHKSSDIKKMRREEKKILSLIANR